MIPFEDAGAYLDEVADNLPPAFMMELNGGILLSPEESRRYDLPGAPLTMGVYRRDHTGRSIEIYYGSFAAAYPHADAAFCRDELRRTLLHEFTHHLETLAGERGLERKDEQEIARYLERLR